MNILIVEDEKDLEEAVKHILQKAGHSADIAGDGLLALDYIRTEGYDLILLDIMLPGLDGLGVLRKMRSEKIPTPVLMLTDPSMVYSKEVLITRAWGMDSEASDNNVEAYVSFLRKKLRYLNSCVTIRNLQKIGYRLEVSA